MTEVKPLLVEKVYETGGKNTMKITGFTDAELKELNSMTYHEMIDAVLDQLDKRNGNKGTCWANGYGVFGMWIKGNAVYTEIGNSCD